MTILSESTLPVARKSQPWDSFLANSKVPQGQTDELLTWLSKVNQKKQSIRTTRHRDLRKEAMLESARLAAQAQLEMKQRERMQKWRTVMTTISPPAPTEVDETLCDCDCGEREESSPNCTNKGTLNCGVCRQVPTW